MTADDLNEYEESVVLFLDRHPQVLWWYRTFRFQILDEDDYADRDWQEHFGKCSTNRPERSLTLQPLVGPQPASHRGVGVGTPVLLDVLLAGGGRLPVLAAVLFLMLGSLAVRFVIVRLPHPSSYDRAMTPTLPRPPGEGARR